MNGPNEIRNINTARALEALQGLKVAAETATKQGHPTATERQSRYEKLASELGVAV